MSAFWTAIAVATPAIGLLTGVVTLTEKGHGYWRKLVDFVKFWRTLKKRVEELEAPPKPRTWEQQMCPLCGERGRKFTKIKASKQDGRHSCWYRCDPCEETWPVWID